MASRRAAAIIQGVAEQARDAIDRAKQLQDTQQTWRRKLTLVRSSSLLLHLADCLFENPVLTIPQAQRLLNVRSYHTAQRRVEKLVEEGILVQIGRDTQTRLFLAEAIYRIISHP